MATVLCNMKWSQFQGLLRIILMEAQNLIAKDNMMGGMVKGKSDPYAKIRVGEFEVKSHVIKENLNPVWNEMYEVCTYVCTKCKQRKNTFFCSPICILYYPQVLLSPQSGCDVQVELFDKDMDKDDFLGR